MAETLYHFPPDSLQEYVSMAKNSIAMLDKDHHIHLVPVDRILMMSIEHSAIRKIDGSHYELECTVKLSVEGFPHPLEDAIRLSFASVNPPGQDLMAELTFVQNAIVKYIFDRRLAGELCDYDPDDPRARETGITVSSEIKAQMLVSQQIREVLARHGALPDSLTFHK